MAERELPEQPIDSQGERQESRDTVYSLIRPEHIDSLLENRPALSDTIPMRVHHGNDLIDLWASQHEHEGPYHPGMRSRALFAYPDPDIPEDVARSEATLRPGQQRSQLALDVDPTATYTAVRGPGLPLSYGAWEGARMNLIEGEGISPARVDEVLDHITDDSEQPVSAGYSWISHVPPEEREPLLKYFDEPIRAYVESFQTLSDYRKHPEGGRSVEVIIPEGQLKAARRYEEGA